MTRTPHIVALWIVALAVGSILDAANLHFGEVNQDEGWYLYAARLVSEGRMPYRDFAFTQAPVMPVMYSWVQPVVHRWGMAGGRLFTSLLGLAAALCAAGLAARLVERKRKAAAALLAFVLIAVNVYQSYFFTVAKTYSLCSLWLVLGLLLTTFAGPERGSLAVLAAFLSGLALTCAAGTRVSAGIVLPVVFVYFLLNHNRGRAAWAWFGLGCAVAGAVVFLPFLLTARENFLFGVAQYHALRRPADAGFGLLYKAGAVSRLVQAYFVAAAIGVGVGLARWLRPEPADAAPAGPAAAPVEPPAPSRFGPSALLWAVGIAVTLVHLSAPFPYEDYQVIVFPVFAAALAAAVVRLIGAPGMMRWVLATVTLVSIGASFSSPINQDWFVRGRDRIWWHLREQPPLRRLHEAAMTVRSLAGPDGLLLTQDTYLAVESGLRVPHGLELGPFSYYPDWDTEQAQRRHVVNRPLLEELLRHSGAAVAAFSGYGLAIKAPEVSPLPPERVDALWSVLRENYTVTREVDYFGQCGTRLRILCRKSTAPEAP